MVTSDRAWNAREYQKRLLPHSVRREKRKNHFSNVFSSSLNPLDYDLIFVYLKTHAVEQLCKYLRFEMAERHSISYNLPRS